MDDTYCLFLILPSTPCTNVPKVHDIIAITIWATARQDVTPELFSKGIKDLFLFLALGFLIKRYNINLYIRLMMVVT
jgi:hypothetical protein